MAEFKIVTSKTDQLSDAIKSYKSSLSSAGDEISKARKQLYKMAGSFPQVSLSLISLTTQTDRYSDNMQTLSDTLKTISTTYQNTENDLAGRDVLREKKDSGWRWLVGEVTKNKWYEREATGSILRKDYGNGSIVDILKGTASYSLLGTLQSPKYSDKKWKEHKPGKILKDIQWVKDKDGQLSFPEMTEYAKKKATIAEATLAEGKLEGSILEASYKGKYGDASVKVGNAEAHGSVTAGLYGYTKDGKKMFAPAVEATVGASVCVLTAQANGEIGSDMLGASGHAEVSAGKASAEATANFAVFGKDGKLNPQAKVSASAEAIAAEAKGSASVKVAGVEGTVTGSVNFGVGAHADIGIVDGKVKCDIGASLGVGASIGFEIDTKPAVNAVVNGAKAVWKALRWK